MSDIIVLEDFDYNGGSILIPITVFTPDMADANAVTTPDPIVIGPASADPSATTPDATAVVPFGADAHSVTAPDPIVIDPASAGPSATTPDATAVVPVGADANAVTTPDPIVIDPASASPSATMDTTHVAVVGIDAFSADGFVPSSLHISLNDGWFV